MNALQQTAGLAAFELRGAARSRWVSGGGLVFAAATLAATIAGLRSFSSLGLAGAGAATDGIAQVALLLPPLVGLLLGAGTMARDRERGMLGMLATQPMRRGLLPVAAFAGCVLATSVVVALGFALSLLVLSTAATLADLTTLAAVLAISLAVSAAAVALGVAISALAATHQQATAAAASLWLLLALGLDLLLAGVAPGLRLGPSGLLVAVLANPLEAGRVLAVLTIDGGTVLGPLGAYLQHTFGRAGSIGLLATALTLWTAAPLALAGVVTARRDS